MFHSKELDVEKSEKKNFVEEVNCCILVTLFTQLCPHLSLNGGPTYWISILVQFDTLRNSVELGAVNQNKNFIGEIKALV